MTSDAGRIVPSGVFLLSSRTQNGVGAREDVMKSKLYRLFVVVILAVTLSGCCAKNGDCAKSAATVILRDVPVLNGNFTGK